MFAKVNLRHFALDVFYYSGTHCALIYSNQNRCMYFLVVKQPRELAVKLSEVWIRILINDMVFSSNDFLIDSEYGLSGRKGKTALFLHSCVRHTGKQRSRTLEDSGPLRTQEPRGPRTLKDPELILIFLRSIVLNPLP